MVFPATAEENKTEKNLRPPRRKQKMENEMLRTDRGAGLAKLGGDSFCREILFIRTPP